MNTPNPYALHLYHYLSAAKAAEVLSAGALPLQPLPPFAGPLSVPALPLLAADAQAFARVLEQVCTLADQRRGGQGWCTPDRQALQQAGAACAGHCMASNRIENCLQALRGLMLFTRPDHQALWAYYGDDNKGCCLELMIPLPPSAGRWAARPVRYLPEPPFYDAVDALAVCAEGLVNSIPFYTTLGVRVKVGSF